MFTGLIRYMECAYLMYDSFVSPPGDYRDYSEDETYESTEEEENVVDVSFDDIDEWQVRLE